MKVIFLGTPDFAVESLKTLCASKHKVIAVVTQPDRPVGRKGVITPSPVKVFALNAGLNVLQYEKLSVEGVSDLKKLNADIMVTCAFGQILSAEILSLTKYGVINVHASLLPKYRGASPIQAAIINGETETGVTIMQTEPTLDSGDILAVKKVVIGEDETAGELFDRLSDTGAKLLAETLDKIESGDIVRIKQDESKATFVKPIKKQDGLINWSKTKKQIKDLVRGMNPWPIAYTYLNGKMLKIFSVSESEDIINGEDGAIKITKNKIAVKCKDGSLFLNELQSDGGKRMTGGEFVLGHRNIDGAILKNG